jgi:putative nucleotidyltransferase with HDIG domain
MATKPTLFEQLRSSEQHVAETETPDEGLRYSWQIKALIVFLTTLVTTFFFPTRVDISVSQKTSASSQIGLPWTSETVKAKFPFPIFKNPDSLKKEIEFAKSQIAPVFVRDTFALQSALRGIDNLTRLFPLGGVVAGVVPSEDSAGLYQAFSKQALTQFFTFPASEQQRFLKEFRPLAEDFFKTVYSRGFIDTAKDALAAPEITVRLSPVQEELLPTTELIDSSAYRKISEQFFVNRTQPGILPLAVELVRGSMIPNIVYSNKLTEQAKKLAEQSVAQTLGIVHSNEIIIAKGERVTPVTVLKLQSYEDTRRFQDKASYSLPMFLGSFGHAGLIYSLLVLYLYYIRKKIFADNYQLGGISLILIVVSLLSWITIKIPTVWPIEYAVLIPAFSMLIAIIFDSRTAFYATVTMSLFLAGIRGNDYATGTAAMLAGTLGAYTVRDIQSPMQIFRSIFFILLGYSIAILSFGLERAADTRTIVQQLLMASINSAIAPLFTFGLLMLLEKFTDLNTDMRLNEYDNLNHPLLLQLNEKAPGTYQHTMMIARLAESAARAIGARPLLAKVGSYFHDIGKLAKSEYFVENQINIDNKHDRLSPKKSTKIIRDHVQDGIELAEEYKLPKKIIEFIPMHHGTMLIKHFYAKALEDAISKGLTINEDDYRYPGPKPATKEAAIVMLADSVEAISRTMNTDDKDELDKAISAIFRDRLMDGQLDNTDLTLKDLSQIREAFVKNLMGIHHQRIAYKQIPTQPNANDRNPQEPAEPR